MQTVTPWLICPTHGYVKSTSPAIKAGAGGTFIDSHGECPVDLAVAPMIGATYSVSNMGVLTIQPHDAEAAAHFDRIRQEHPGTPGL